jgi:hypothetical protein
LLEAPSGDEGISESNKFTYKAPGSYTSDKPPTGESTSAVIDAEEEEDDDDDFARMVCSFDSDIMKSMLISSCKRRWMKRASDARGLLSTVYVYSIIVQHSVYIYQPAHVYLAASPTSPSCAQYRQPVLT